MPDPDLKMGGGGGGRGEGGGGGREGGRGGVGKSSKKPFSALRASVWSKNKGGPKPPPRALGSATAQQGICDIHKEN